MGLWNREELSLLTREIGYRSVAAGLLSGYHALAPIAGRVPLLKVAPDMKISDQDADLFFELMFPLQFFVNQQRHVLPDVNTLEEYLACPIEQKLLVRDALYENSPLIDTFIQQNLQQLSDDNLAIVAKWKQFIAGEFFIERMLKRYAVFISSDNEVYGVLALHQPFQEIFDSSSLPVFVKTVLLPFKGRIVFDGILEPYSISFGRGVSSSLKETYMAAKQNGKVIESLEPDLHPVKGEQRSTVVKDWRPEIAALAAEARKLRSSEGEPAIQRPAFSLVKASLELAQSAVQDPEDLDALWRSLRKVGNAVSRVETILHRSQRYR